MVTKCMESYSVGDLVIVSLCDVTPAGALTSAIVIRNYLLLQLTFLFY